MSSKHPARDAANKTEGKEAGLSIRCPSSSERAFWGTLCAFGNAAAKAGRERKDVSKKEAASQAKNCPFVHEIFSQGSHAAKHAALFHSFGIYPAFLQIPRSSHFPWVHLSWKKTPMP